jgi:hypothetical protein
MRNRIRSWKQTTASDELEQDNQKEYVDLYQNRWDLVK